MRKLLTAMFAMVFLIAGTATATMAQATPEAGGGEASGTAYADGLNQGATYFDERGDAQAVLSVTDVERGWDGYDEYSEPDRGYEYVLVTFTVEVVGPENLTVEQYGFSLVDSLGLNNNAAYAQAADNADVELFEEDAAVASGETFEASMVFQVFTDADLGFLMWQPDSGLVVLVNISEAS